MPHPLKLLAVVLVAAAGSAINAIAGGGTLLTFPALIALGVSPIVANATSTVALWPGSFASMVGYRGELAGARRWAIRFALPSLAGGLVGAALLLATPAERFSAIVPYLVLLATTLFLAQQPIMRRVARRRAARLANAPVGSGAGRDAADAMPPPPLPFLVYQFGVGIYGGYFGAGAGILMLAALGFMGLTNIHRMNGLKNWGGLCMNATAAITFAFTSLVNWPVATSMAVGALLGGYAASRLAQRVPQTYVRRAIVAIGFASAIWLLLSR